MISYDLSGNILIACLKNYEIVKEIWIPHSEFKCFLKETSNQMRKYQILDYKSQNFPITFLDTP